MNRDRLADFEDEAVSYWAGPHEPPRGSRIECRRVGSQWAIWIPAGPNEHSWGLGLMSVILAAVGTLLVGWSVRVVPFQR